MGMDLPRWLMEPPATLGRHPEGCMKVPGKMRLIREPVLECEIG